jgi:5-methylcytosine-specific restriction enzyme A
MTGRDPLQSAAWRAFRLRVLARDGHRCQIGGPRCTKVATQVDHRIPRADGGAVFDLANVRAACAACNGRGGAERTNEQRRRTGDRRWYKTSEPTSEMRM